MRHYWPYTMARIMSALRADTPWFRTNWALSWKGDLVHTPQRYPWRAAERTAAGDGERGEHHVAMAEERWASPQPAH